MESTEQKAARFFPSLRFVTAVMLQLAMLISLMIRFNIGTAFLCMVGDPTDSTNTSNLTGTDVKSKPGEFDWSISYQGWIVSAYFYAFVVFLVPGGWLVDRFGAQYMLQIGMLVAGVTCLVIPVLTRLHGGLLIAARAVLGATNCLIIPSVPALSRLWSLPGEYTSVFAIAWSGFYLGTAVSFPLGSALCQSSWSWPGVFYVSGIISMAWMVLSAFLIKTIPWKSGGSAERRRRASSAVRQPQGRPKR
ncbi:putative inorganic phosphate cotransporter [Pollicipes pollicipes]|uniref:putative inorganic phosphate cotransporter n=1 Tax=Pollicipes pollicipes TaxID=41117 RepID=UPI001884D3A7|nr:putative inorganic phosphate cotransporter [Pollicipes pollicipes]